jgi:hypothetical protein
MDLMVTEEPIPNAGVPIQISKDWKVRITAFAEEKESTPHNIVVWKGLPDPSTPANKLVDLMTNSLETKSKEFTAPTDMELRVRVEGASGLLHFTIPVATGDAKKKAWIVVVYAPKAVTGPSGAGAKVSLAQSNTNVTDPQVMIDRSFTTPIGVVIVRAETP